MDKVSSILIKRHNFYQELCCVTLVDLPKKNHKAGTITIAVFHKGRLKFREVQLFAFNNTQTGYTVHGRANIKPRQSDLRN